MKILHLCRLYLPHRGGVETHVAEVSSVLINQGHQVTVVTEQLDPQQPLIEVVNDAHVVRIPYEFVKSKRRVWQWMWSQRSYLFDADVIQVHDVFWWLLPSLPLLEQKVFTTFHGWETQYPIRWQAKLQRWLYAQLSQATIHIGAWIQEFYWDRPTAISYGGVTVPKKLANPSTPNEVTVVFVGRLSKDTEILKYIELIKKLKENKVKFTMTWVGDGDLKKECEEVGKTVGLVENPTKYMNQATVVFASSYLSILEAQAVGKVVVSFYSHKLKQRYLETYPGAEQMIIESNVELMTEKVKALLKDRRKLEQLGQQSHDFAATQTWEKVAGLYLSLWQKRES